MSAGVHQHSRKLRVRLRRWLRTLRQYQLHRYTNFCIGFDGGGQCCPYFTDIDECRIELDGCQQNCTDSDGSYSCSCSPGFKLDDDGFACNGRSILCAPELPHLSPQCSSLAWPIKYLVTTGNVHWSMVQPVCATMGTSSSVTTKDAVVRLHSPQNSRELGAKINACVIAFCMEDCLPPLSPTAVWRLTEAHSVANQRS